jgi:tetratricopeptide (TPR) repeat protein
MMFMRFRASITRRHLRQGDAARDAQRWERACSEYEHALERNPSLDHIWVQLGHTRKEIGRLSDAEMAYKRALAQKPGTADTHLQLGHLMKIMGRTDEAVRYYAKAAEIDPQDGNAVRELTALGYSSAGRRVFGMTFSGPLKMYRSDDRISLEVLAVLDGLLAEDALQLVAHQGLRVSYGLRLGSSGSTVVASGFAAIETVDLATLRCRIFLDAEVFDGDRPGVLHLCLVYESGSGIGEANNSAAWLAVCPSGIDLGNLYRVLTEGKAEPIGAKARQ